MGQDRNLLEEKIVGKKWVIFMISSTLQQKSYGTRISQGIQKNQGFGIHTPKEERKNKCDLSLRNAELHKSVA